MKRIGFQREMKKKLRGIEETEEGTGSWRTGEGEEGVQEADPSRRRRERVAPGPHRVVICWAEKKVLLQILYHFGER